MKLSQDQRLSKSGLYIPDQLFQMEAQRQYSRKNRTIWTRDGEIQVPMKKAKKRGVLAGLVSNVWAKDERGNLLFSDPVGDFNTISDGALYDILQTIFGYWSNGDSIAFDTEVAVNLAQGIYGPWYNDGTYNFPNINDLMTYYNGTDTYYAYVSASQVAYTLFRFLWFLNDVSGGLTGSHLPSAVAGTGFLVANTNDPNYLNGWFSEPPTAAWGTTNTTMSDSVSNATSGTPQISHTLTLSLSSSGTSFTFDGIAWVPSVAYTPAGNGAGYFTAGYTLDTTSPTWASTSTTPTTIDNLMVSALWVPGYAITMNPGGSWGFTYTFQM